MYTECIVDVPSSITMLMSKMRHYIVFRLYPATRLIGYRLEFFYYYKYGKHSMVYWARFDKRLQVNIERYHGFRRRAAAVVNLRNVISNLAMYTQHEWWQYYVF